MIALKKRLCAPVAALVAVSLLAGAVEAAPRDLTGRDHHRELRDERPVQYRDHRRGGDRFEHHDRGWRHGPHRDWHTHGRFGKFGHRMGQKEMRRTLRHKGFHKIRIEDRRPLIFKVSAVGHNGVPFRLVVDRVSGKILHIRPVGRGFHWSYRW